ncbi:MAG: DUF411 domain-containing protein [Rhodothermia bacterium]|nr:MAG: DUF411 domain-containing protein [Rhodothermia bacterium]
MKKITVIAAAVGLILVGLAFSFLLGDAAAATKIVVNKTATCGCCGGWVEHLKNAGFDVEVNDISQANLNSIKNQYGIDRKYWACHTAVINGYVVEGHVPAEQIVRLLAEGPEIAGLAVPGMPAGSPGMEMANKSMYQSFDILAFNKDGSSSVYHHVE